MSVSRSWWGSGEGVRGRGEVSEVLAAVSDPRQAGGIRHRMVVIVSVAVCAVAAGARSFAAIGQWAATCGPDLLTALGIDGPPPSESCVRRTLHRADTDHLDTAVGGWAARRYRPRQGQTTGCGRSRWTARHCAAPLTARQAAREDRLQANGICWPLSTTTPAW